MDNMDDIDIMDNMDDMLDYMTFMVYIVEKKNKAAATKSSRLVNFQKYFVADFLLRYFLHLHRTNINFLNPLQCAKVLRVEDGL